MSKLIDRLKRVSRSAPQPMGFRASSPEQSQPRMLIVASLESADVNNLADCVSGADSGLLHIPDPGVWIKTLERANKQVPDIPWGAWLKAAGDGITERLAKAKCDFVVFSAADTPMALLQGSEMGRIVEIEASLGDSLLRSVNRLPVDAVLAVGEVEPDRSLTWHHLMRFQRLSDLLTKPLLTPVPASVTSSELQALWEAGVSGIVVPAVPEQPSRLKELRQIVAKLNYSTRRGKVDVVLPRIGVETEAPIEEEEEEEDE